MNVYQMSQIKKRTLYWIALTYRICLDAQQQCSLWQIPAQPNLVQTVLVVDDIQDPQLIVSLPKPKPLHL